MIFKVNIGTRFGSFANIIVEAENEAAAGQCALAQFVKTWPIYSSCCFVSLVSRIHEYPFRNQSLEGKHNA